MSEEFVPTPMGTIIETTLVESLWDGEGSSREEVDAACGVTKACRNMQHVNFDPVSLGHEPGSDLGVVWRDKLRREGKLAEGATSLGDLILGGAHGAA